MKNIMIQVSAKISASPWGLKGLPLMDVPTMIIGIDVVHHVGRNKVSVVGFAASIDRYISRYYIDSVVKRPSKEGKTFDMTFELEKLYQTAIIKFQEINGVPPQRIIIYRDS